MKNLYLFLAIWLAVSPMMAKEAKCHIKRYIGKDKQPLMIDILVNKKGEKQQIQVFGEVFYAQHDDERRIFITRIGEVGVALPQVNEESILPTVVKGNITFQCWFE